MSAVAFIAALSAVTAVTVLTAMIAVIAVIFLAVVIIIVTVVVIVMELWLSKSSCRMKSYSVRISALFSKRSLCVSVESGFGVINVARAHFRKKAATDSEKLFYLFRLNRYSNDCKC